jgi:hypothetical protein
MTHKLPFVANSRLPTFGRSFISATASSSRQMPPHSPRRCWERTPFFSVNVIDRPVCEHRLSSPQPQLLALWLVPHLW